MIDGDDMCDPVSAIVGAVAGLGAMAMSSGSRPSAPSTPVPEPAKPEPPPQEARVPTPQELRKPTESTAIKTGMAATPADTFLTGSQGVRLTEKDTKRKTLLGE